MSLQELEMTDFSRGVREQTGASSFIDGQHARIRGFVLDDVMTLRSQWEVQGLPAPNPSSGSLVDPSISVLEGVEETFIVISHDNGQLYWITEADLTGPNPSWTFVSTAGGENQGWTFGAGQVDFIDPNGRRVSALLSTPHENDNAIFVYEDLDNLGTLTFEKVGDRIPSGSLLEPDSGVMPRGRVTGMWQQFLLVADGEWRDDTDEDLSDSNRRETGNTLWFSLGGLSTTFPPLPHLVGPSNVTITGLVPIAEGLLVLTSRGVWLLRGEASGNLIDGEVDPRWRQEELHPGVSATGGILYTSAQVIVFADEYGQVWATNGREIGRLNRWSPEVQLTPFAAVDRYVLAADTFDEANPRWFVFQLVNDEEGSWTELVLDGIEPDTGKLIQRTAVTDAGNVLWLAETAGGWKLARMLVREGGDRGRVDGVQVDLELITATVGDPERFEKKMWHRVGGRLRGLGPGEVVEVTAYGAGPVGDGPPPVSHTTVLGETIEDRHAFWAPAGIGGTVEAAVGVVVRGDVQMEAVSLFAHGRRRWRGRPSDGSGAVDL